MKQKNKFWILWILLLATTQVSASIDLINPVDQSALNYQNITFDYYPDLSGGLDECSLIVNDNVLIIDSDVQNSAPNSFNVANTPEDEYDWEILCDGLGGSETSSQQSFIVDITNPVVTLLSPDNEFVSDSAVTFIFKVTDNIANDLNCNLTIDGQSTQSITAGNNTQEVINLNNVNPGDHEWGITCVDLAGNLNSKTRDITVSNEVVFSIGIDKSTFSIGEEGVLTILAPNSTNLTLEICPDGQGFVECFAAITLEEPTYPRQEVLPYTNVTGNYIVDAYFAYLDIREARRLTYSVVNNMAVAINGKTTLKKSEYIDLTGSAIGGSGALQYTWTTHNGSTRTGTHLSMLTDTVGSYTESLTVSDEAGNSASKDITISVIEAFEVTVVVQDEAGNALDGAAVDLDNDKESTEAGGVVTFLARTGDIDLVVFLSGYQTNRQTITSTGDQTITVTLIKEETGLEIVLDTPEDGEKIESGESSFGFFLKEAENAVCKLYTDSTDDGFFDERGTIEVKDESRYEFIVELEDGEYTWIVECTQNGETIKSSERSLTIGNPGVEEAPVEETAAATTTSSNELNTASMLDELSSILDKYARLGSKEKNVLEDLGHYKHAKDMIKKVQRATRDMYDLNFRTSLTDEQKEAERQKIVNDIKEGFDKTVSEIQIKDTKIFVKYPEKEEIEPLAEVYGEYEKYVGKPETLTKSIHSLQGEVVISTRAHVVKITRLDQTSQTITTVIKEVKTELDKEQHQIVDYIPKELAESTEDLTFISDYKVIREDPVIKFEVEDKIVYYFNDELELKSLDQIISVIVKEGMTYNLKGVSGSAILGGFSPSFDIDSKSLLIFVVIVLLLFYFIGESSFMDTLKEKLSGKKKDKEIHYVKVLVNDALDNLDADQYDKASLIYREIKLTYDNMMHGAREEVFTEIMALVNKLDIAYSRELSAKIEEALSINDYGTAQDLYRKLQATYRKLDEDYKKEIYTKITSITGKINER